jgi:hypothetical protein
MWEVKLMRRYARLHAEILLLAAIISTGCGKTEPNLQTKEKNDMAVESMSQIDSGYRSATTDWQQFLVCWEERMLQERAKQKDALSIPLTQMVEPGSSAYAENVEALDAAERRLGLKLPASYRHFAALTGGYWLDDGEGDQYLSTETPPSHFLPIGAIDLFKNIDKFNWPIWDKNRYPGGTVNEVYYIYDSFEGGKQDAAKFRDGHLDHLIKIGEFRGGAVVLLNPKEVTSDGEHEAWFLAPYIAGAARYRSFAELMQFRMIAELYGARDVISSSEKHNSCARLLITAANSATTTSGGVTKEKPGSGLAK